MYRLEEKKDKMPRSTKAAPSFKIRAPKSASLLASLLLMALIQLFPLAIHA